MSDQLSKTRKGLVGDRSDLKATWRNIIGDYFPRKFRMEKQVNSATVLTESHVTSGDLVWTLKGVTFRLDSHNFTSTAHEFYWLLRTHIASDTFLFWKMFLYRISWKMLAIYLYFYKIRYINWYFIITASDTEWNFYTYISYREWN